MSSSDPDAKDPRVLFVYFTYTQQSLKVAEAMAAVLRERGWVASLARVELTDPRWAERFTRFPLRHALVDISRDDAGAVARGDRGDRRSRGSAQW